MAPLAGASASTAPLGSTRDTRAGIGGRVKKRAQAPIAPCQSSIVKRRKSSQVVSTKAIAQISKQSAKKVIVGDDSDNYYDKVSKSGK